MTSKAKKLAWELVDIFRAHSDRDIQEALRLLESGELLQKPLALARASATASRQRKSIAPAQLAHLTATSPENLEYADPQITDFARSAMKGEILSSSRELRAYGELLGLKLPKKVPSRAFMVRRIARRLEEVQGVDRQNLIRMSRSENRSESALKAWSDLIVKS